MILVNKSTFSVDELLSNAFALHANLGVCQSRNNVVVF